METKNKTYTIQEMRDSLYDIMEFYLPGEDYVEFVDLEFAVNEVFENTKAVTVTMVDGEITNLGFCQVLVEIAKRSMINPGITEVYVYDNLGYFIMLVFVEAGKIKSGCVKRNTGTMQEFENGEQPNLKQIAIFEENLKHAEEVIASKPSRVIESTYRTALPILQELQARAVLGFDTAFEIEEYADMFRESYHDTDDYEESCVFRNMIEILRDISLEMDE